MRHPICRRCAHCSFYQRSETGWHQEILIKCTKGLMESEGFISECSGYDRRRRSKGKPSWLR